MADATSVFILEHREYNKGLIVSLIAYVGWTIEDAIEYIKSPEGQEYKNTADPYWFALFDATVGTEEVTFINFYNADGEPIEEQPL